MHMGTLHAPVHHQQADIDQPPRIAGVSRDNECPVPDVNWTIPAKLSRESVREERREVSDENRAKKGNNEHENETDDIAAIMALMRSALDVAVTEGT